MSLHCQPALDEILFEWNRLIVFNEALEAFRVSQKDDSLKIVERQFLNFLD
jgi:hypothetical protein